MITISIPGFTKKELRLQHLILDFNGTLAIDGKIINGVREKLKSLSEKLQLHVLTGNSFGTAEEELKDVPCKLHLLPAEEQGFEKGKYVALLGKDSVISIGNGNNDHQLLLLSAIGIIVIQKEGASAITLANADVICTSIIDALDLISNPVRLKATLRT